MSFNALPDALILVCLARHFAFEHSESGVLCDGWRLLLLRRFTPAQAAILKSHTPRICTLPSTQRCKKEYSTELHEQSQTGVTRLVRQPSLVALIRGKYTRVVYPWVVKEFTRYSLPYTWNEEQKKWVYVLFSEFFERLAISPPGGPVVPPQ